MLGQTQPHGLSDFGRICGAQAEASSDRPPESTERLDEFVPAGATSAAGPRDERDQSVVFILMPVSTPPAQPSRWSPWRLSTPLQLPLPTQVRTIDHSAGA